MILDKATVVAAVDDVRVKALALQASMDALTSLSPNLADFEGAAATVSAALAAKPAVDSLIPAADAADVWLAVND